MTELPTKTAPSAIASVLDVISPSTRARGAESHRSLRDDVARDHSPDLHVVGADVSVEPALGRERDVTPSGEIPLHPARQGDAGRLDVGFHASPSRERHLLLRGDRALDLPVDPEGAGRHHDALDPRPWTDHGQVGALDCWIHTHLPDNGRTALALGLCWGCRSGIGAELRDDPFGYGRTARSALVLLGNGRVPRTEPATHGHLLWDRVLESSKKHLSGTGLPRRFR